MLIIYVRAHTFTSRAHTFTSRAHTFTSRAHTFTSRALPHLVVHDGAQAHDAHVNVVLLADQPRVFQRPPGRQRVTPAGNRQDFFILHFGVDMLAVFTQRTTARSSLTNKDVFMYAWFLCLLLTPPPPAVGYNPRVCVNCEPIPSHINPGSTKGRLKEH